MAIDAKDEAGNLVHLTVRDRLTTADWRTEVEMFVAKPFRAIPIEYFTAESSARTWLAD